MTTRCVSFSEFQATPRPGVQWLVHGLIPKPGRFLLCGLPKVGKSNLALQIALAVSQGRDFLGCKVEKGRALFLQFDATDFEWKARFDTLQDAGVDLSGDNFVVKPEALHLPFNSQALESQTWLQEVLDEVKPDLVVLDVLAELHTADENEASEMRAACRPLFHLLRPYSTLLLHHTTKLDDGVDYDPIKAARGSGYLTGAVSAVGLLHNGKLRVKSRLAGELELRGKLNDVGLWIFEDDNPQAVWIRVHLLQLLEQHPTMPLRQLYTTYVFPTYHLTWSSFLRKIGSAGAGRPIGAGPYATSQTCKNASVPTQHASAPPPGNIQVPWLDSYSTADPGRPDELQTSAVQSAATTE